MNGGPLSVLLFDLGGVLVENASIVEGLGALLGRRLDDDEVKERWLRSPVARDFELGRVSPEVFAARFLREWGSTVDPRVFLEGPSLLARPALRWGRRAPHAAPRPLSRQLPYQLQ